MPRGRPTKLTPAHIKQAYHLALLGATDADMARAFDVDVSTIDRWKKRDPAFCVSLKRGKEEADANVSTSLYRRAMGYSHPAVKIIAVPVGNNQGSEVREVPYIERYAPDTTAAIFWLKNRRPDLWRDKQAIEHSGPNGGPIEVGTNDVRSRVASRIAGIASRSGMAISPERTNGNGAHGP